MTISTCDRKYDRVIICPMTICHVTFSPRIMSCAKGADAITRFRLGSHNLPIETGRWSRTPRENRLCPRCKVLGDEIHFLFHCSETIRNPDDFIENLSEIWKNKNIFELFNELSKSEYLKYY